VCEAVFIRLNSSKSPLNLVCAGIPFPGASSLIHPAGSTNRSECLTVQSIEHIVGRHGVYPCFYWTALVDVGFGLFRFTGCMQHRLPMGPRQAKVRVIPAEELRNECNELSRSVSPRRQGTYWLLPSIRECRCNRTGPSASKLCDPLRDASQAL
jgi:hypothetical protein